MTLRHAAARTGLSATTLRRYIKAGRLKARLSPGRYGPEYVVTDDDLRGANVEPSRRAPAPAPAAPPELAVAPTTTGAVVALAAPDAIPGLLYRELLMKHEHLLVQYGMLRVSGQQLYEVRRDAERRATELRQAVAELAAIRDRHAREIGALKAQLRQAELEIAARDDENAQLRGETRRLEIALRNAATVSVIDEAYREHLTHTPAAPPPVHSAAAPGAHPSDH